MPSLWRWVLADAGPVDRRAVHRLLCRWLDTDHHAARKGWSWTPVALAGGAVAVEIGIVDDDLAGWLVTGTGAYRRAGRFEPGLAMRHEPVQIAAASWERLRSPGAGRERTFEFASPVTFRRGNQFLPWPSPSAVFGGLRAIWHAFGAPRVGDVTLDLSLDPLVVTSVTGTTKVERVVLHERSDGAGSREPVEVTVGGFVGRVCYEWAATANEQLPAFHALTRLAPYCGVGAWTTRGFGGTRPRDG